MATQTTAPLAGPRNPENFFDAQHHNRRATWWLSAVRGLNSSPARHAVGILSGALLLTWPAFYNGFPLLYPDSMTYLLNGWRVARALFLHKFLPYYGMRSFIYSLGIFPWHWNITPWPILGLQAFLTAYVMWLCRRSLVKRPTALGYVIFIAALSMLTSLSWFVSLVMPDILGPVLYLCIYLLVFASETLSYTERAAVGVIAWWAVASHATHLMVAIAICIGLALMGCLSFRPMHGRLKAVGHVVLIILLAVIAELSLNAYLYGKPSLNGYRPPFLIARVIADGPGRWYLQQHCREPKFVVCEYVTRLPDSANDFLWAEHGIWHDASDQTRKQLLSEEAPFVLAVLKAYPGAQLSKSMVNSWNQLTTFDLEVFDSNAWTLQQFDRTLHRGRSSYLQSREAQDDLPLEDFSVLGEGTVIVSLVVLLLFLPRLWKCRSAALSGLSVIVSLSVVANAVVTGALSTVENRYQSRIAWLLPCLAYLLLEHLYGHRVTVSTLLRAKHPALRRVVNLAGAK
jgi:hypothetical protein